VHGEALRHLGRVDPRFCALARRHGPPGIRRSRNHFRSLVRAVIGQQLSGAAAATIWRRFCRSFDGPFPRPERVLAVPEVTLRGAGLSRAKARTVRDLAAKLTDGTIPRRRLGSAPDAEVRASLTQVVGIGDWTVDMFLIFALARPDVLPVGDLGVRKGVARHFDLPALPDPSTMQALTTPWRPHRSVGVWYMWRLLEGPR
jgi:DNA-3-methyladenine glycosylase II